MDERERIDDQQPEDLEVRDDHAEDVKGGLNFASQGEVVPTTRCRSTSRGVETVSSPTTTRPS